MRDHGNVDQKMGKRDMGMWIRRWGKETWECRRGNMDDILEGRRKEMMGI